MAVETKKLIDQLEDTRQLDIDAVEAYGEAIKRIDHATIRDRLIEFRADHERHITELDGCIRQLGGMPKKRKADLKGFLIEGFTALRSAIGIEGALKAMRSNEKLTNRRYGEAVTHGFPADIQRILENGRDDEKRHLAYIEDCLAQKTWETGTGEPYGTPIR